MRDAPEISVMTLVNGSTGDPVLYVDFPGLHNAVLFDCGEVAPLPNAYLKDVATLCVTHHHLDHLAGFDRVLRANVDTDKTLAIFGPRDTIDRLRGKLQAFAYPRFPFMKLRVRIHEARIAAGSAEETHDDGPGWRVVEGTVEDGFKEFKEVRSRTRAPKVWHQTPECRIVGVPMQHSVPCLAYVMEVRAGYRFDPAKAAGGVLKAGPWVRAVRKALTLPKKDRPELIDVGGHLMKLSELTRDYFTREPRRRIVFLTDALHDEGLIARLRPHAEGADVLFCDAYYAAKDGKAARKHRHHTAEQAGELAQALGVEELRLMHFAKRYASRYDRLVDEARAVFPNTRADLISERDTRLRHL